MMPSRQLIVTLLLVIFIPGCIEVQRALEGAIGEQNSTAGVPDGAANPGDSTGDGGGQATPPTVTLTASNTTPQLNEEVLLRCALVNSPAGGVTFAFQPSDGRLFVDRRAGTAVLIVEETDLNVASSFACTASDDNGTGPASNTVVILPTS